MGLIQAEELKHRSVASNRRGHPKLQILSGKKAFLSTQSPEPQTRSSTVFRGLGWTGFGACGWGFQKLSSHHLGISQNGGYAFYFYTPNRRKSPKKGTPKKGTPMFGNPHLASRDLDPRSTPSSARESRRPLPEIPASRGAR